MFPSPQDMGEADKTLFVGRAQKKEEREKELRDHFDGLKLERQKKYAGVNLYVKNLADTTTEEKIKEEFAQFGAITSVPLATLATLFTLSSYCRRTVITLF
jgi:polyadenylate-binding protein